MLDGHAIEARVYAEDPEHEFLPSTGSLVAVVEPSGDGIRVDSGIRTGSEVSADYDPMLAKVIAWGSDRAEALRRLDAALAGTAVLGVTTNVPFLRSVLADEDVRAGRLDTGLLGRLPAFEQAEPGPEWYAEVPQPRLRRRLGCPQRPTPIRSRCQVVPTVAGTRRLGLLRRPRRALRAPRPRHAARGAHRDPRPRHATAGTPEVRASMPGTVVTVPVTNGTAVEPGQPLVTVEAMKMEHSVARLRPAPSPSTSPWATRSARARSSRRSVPTKESNEHRHPELDTATAGLELHARAGADWPPKVREFADTVIAPASYECRHASARSVLDHRRPDGGARATSGCRSPRSTAAAAASTVDLCIAIEQIAPRRPVDRRSRSRQRSGSARTSLIRWGTEEQKNRWLPDIAAGRAIAGFGLTEADARLGCQRDQDTTAELVGGEWVINGIQAVHHQLRHRHHEHRHHHGGDRPREERLGPELLLDHRAAPALPGSRCCPPTTRSGWHTSDTHPLHVHTTCACPSANLLGERGRGYANFLAHARRGPRALRRPLHRCRAGHASRRRSATRRSASCSASRSASTSTSPSSSPRCRPVCTRRASLAYDAARRRSRGHAVQAAGRDGQARLVARPPWTTPATPPRCSAA